MLIKLLVEFFIMQFLQNMMSHKMYKCLITQPNILQHDKKITLTIHTLYQKHRGNR